MENIADTGYKRIKSMEKMWNKKSRQVSWYARSKADIFENVQSNCFEIIALNPAHFLSGPW